jgi:hypothetical protein
MSTTQKASRGSLEVRGLSIVGEGRFPSLRRLLETQRTTRRILREYLRRRGVKANIDVNPRNRRKPKRGRPYRFNPESYRQMRGSVERFFAWLTGEFRRLALRWKKFASTFLGFIRLACITIYLRVFRWVH